MKLIKQIGLNLKKNYLIPLSILIIIFIFFKERSFFNFFNFKSLITIGSIFGFLALAQGLVIITKGIDLSVGSIANFSSVLCVLLSLKLPDGINPILKVIIIVIVVIISSSLMGSISGFTVVILKVPPLIATLATMWIAKAAAYYPLKGEAVPMEIDEFNLLGSKTFFNLIPLLFIILIILTIIIYFILGNTRAGKYIYFLGGNEFSAYLSGIKVKNIKFLIYSIAGGISAVAGIFITAWTKTGSPRVAEGYEFIAITAVVLGGFSLAGGIGNVWNALLGAFILSIIHKIFIFTRITAFIEGVFIGAILLVSLIVSTLGKREGRI